jgi:hypothetical protein
MVAASQHEKLGDLAVDCRSVVALGGLAIDGCTRQKSVRIEQ